MEDVLEIFGGRALSGEVAVGGAKNAALPIIIATLLTDKPCIIRNIPVLHDVGLLVQLLRQLGGDVQYNSSDELAIQIPKLTGFEASYSLVKSLRASFWVLAPLLARGGAARVAMPGGDVIGARPVDIHLTSLTQMGADIQVKGGVVIASAPHGLRPAEISFRFPSVGATHQLLMAAARTPGRTVLRNAAREPEVVAVADALRCMGAEISGAGTSDIEIYGTDEPLGIDIDVIGDRIEAASYLLAAVATGGQIRVLGIEPEYLGEFLPILSELGADVSIEELKGEERKKAIRLSMSSRPKALALKTGPFPELATDIQAPLMAALTLAEGTSVIEETVYEGRFGHVSELARMGAKITLSGQTATIDGVAQLSGATVEARDIRAGAALVVAGLAAGGRTVVEECQHLRRGYESLEEKFRKLGGRLESSHEEEELGLVGC